MQPPSSREMQSAGQIGIQELQNGHQQQIQGQFDHSSASHDDFFDQMLSNLPTAWADLGTAKSPWDLANGSATDAAGGVHKLFGLGLAGKTAADDAGEGDYGGGGAYDESTLLASRLRQHQISGGGGGSPSGKPMLQLNHLHHPSQQQMLLNMVRSPGAAVGGDPGLLPLPLSLGSGSGADSSHLLVDQSRDEGDGLYNGFGGSLRATAAAQNTNQQHFHNPQGGSMPVQNYGAGPGPGPAQAAGQNGAAAAPPRQRVRARRGQATDPHSIAERLRRERIAERMKALQELVPNANKTDKASMLDEIIDYVKFLQLQVKVLSMSRLGGAAAVAPLVADVSSEAGRGGAGAAGSDSLAVAENQVAKLMEEDMGSAMQYLQGKGLCLMPISLASAISTATCHPRAAAGILGTAAGGNPGLIPAALMGDAPSSPSMSVLTVQSAMANGGGDAGNNKDNAAVSKP